MINPIAQTQIDHIAERCKEIKPLVVIHCLTYNHETYLKDALEGFVMQKTDFPFVAIVHEDASTDKTADVLKEYAEKYPDIIFPIYEEENQYSKSDGSLTEIMTSAIKVTGAKYIAMCEGDDYWIAPNKLQKQCDFLESNPDFGLVHSNFKVYKQKYKVIISNGSKIYKIENGDVFKSLFRGCWIKTLTCFFRTDLFLSKPILKKGIFGGDLALFFHISLNSKIFYINEESGIYRVLEESACRTNNRKKTESLRKSLEKLDFYYADKANLTSSEINEIKRKWLKWKLRFYIGSNRFDVYKKIYSENKNILVKYSKDYFIGIIGKNYMGFKILFILSKLRHTIYKSIIFKKKW